MTILTPIQHICIQCVAKLIDKIAILAFWILCFCFFFPLAAYPQKNYIPENTDPLTEPWRWKHFPELLGKGLRCMNESSDGTFWFGVDTGIIKYNGIDWVSYNKENGFENLAVNNICITKHQKVYAGTDQGIFLLNNNKWDIIFPLLNDTSAKKISKVKCLRVLNDGSIIASVGTSNYTGIIIIRENSQTLISSNKVIKRSVGKFKNLTFKTVPQNITPDDKFEVEEIFEDKQGSLWFSTRNKNKAFLLFTGFIQKTQNDSLIITRIFSKKNGLEHGRTTIINQTSDSKIWVISSDYNIGVNTFNGKTWSYFDLSKIAGEDNLHTSILETDDKTLWIGGMGNLYAFKNNQWKLYREPDFPIPISRINLFKDSKGFLWVLGKHNEVYRIDYMGSSWKTYKNINYQCQTNDGKKWFISVDGRVVVNDNNNWYSYGTENGLPDAPVKLILTSNNYVWAYGSHNSIASTAWFDGTKWNRDLYPYLSWGIDYRAAFEDKDKSLWFGCSVDIDETKGQNGGVIKIDNPNTPNQKITYFNPHETYKTYNVYGIGQSKDGAIWLGGSRLSKFNGKDWVQTDSARKINTYYDYVTNLPNGIMWVGSRYYGIFGFDGNSWINYNVSKGLSSNTVIHILPLTDQNIIVATDNDFCRFDGITWIKNAFPKQLTFGREGGELVAGKNNTIWFNKSLREWKRRALKNSKISKDYSGHFFTVCYTPDTLAPNTYIKDFSKKVSKYGNTTISWKGIDHWHSTPTDKISYSYRLNKSEWSPFQEKNYETFMELKSGKYTLEVRARDLDFNIDKTPETIHFKVLPPIWKQTWFIILILAFISVIVYFQINILKTSKELVELNINLKNAKNQLEEQKEQILEQIKTDRENYQQKIRFFTRISHEFRTPLTVISWITSKLKTAVDGANNPLLMQYTRSLARNSNYMLHLINQLMDFRKLEANSMELHITKGNIVKFIEPIFNNFNTLAHNYNINLEFYANFPGTDTWFDTDKIEKIIVNLVSNAIKFTPEGGKVKLSVIRDIENKDKNDRLLIIVEDTGIGISDDEKEKIFEPFYQGRTVPKRKQEGTGIGLSLVKNLVELHHGILSVKSEPGKFKNEKQGFTTTFAVELPLNEENYVPSEIEIKEIEITENVQDETIYDVIETEEENNTEKNNGLPMVLLVEDNEDLSLLVKGAFKGFYNVEWAINGEEGYNKALEMLPNIIISDIMMPVMDGIEMCKKIKANSSISHIPLILLTAKNSDESQIEGYNAGADDYISKPFSIPILIARVKNLIESRDILRKKFRAELEINAIDKIVPVKEKDFMQKVIGIIEQNISNPNFDVESLSREVGVSSRHLLNKIQSLTDYTPVEFIRFIRLKKAEHLFLNTKLTIAEVAYDVGFSDPNYFSKCFQKQFGKTPKEFITSK